MQGSGRSNFQATLQRPVLRNDLVWLNLIALEVPFHRTAEIQVIDLHVNGHLKSRHYVPILACGRFSVHSWSPEAVASD